MPKTPPGRQAYLQICGLSVYHLKAAQTQGQQHHTGRDVDSSRKQVDGRQVLPTTKPPTALQGTGHNRRRAAGHPANSEMSWLKAQAAGIPPGQDRIFSTRSSPSNHQAPVLPEHHVRDFRGSGVGVGAPDVRLPRRPNAAKASAAHHQVRERTITPLDFDYHGNP